MEVVILPSASEVGALGARKIVRLVRAKPDAVLGLATGSSPLGVYAALASHVRDGSLDVGRVTAFALDEYVGIPVDHPESYASVIHREVTVPLHLDPGRVHVPDGRATDLEAAGERYEEAIRAAGGVDLQILGIGANGHVGFNEPTSSFASRTRIKTLTGRTRADNARFFDAPDEVPTHCLTQGLGTIMAARELLLVAQGRTKAAAVAAAVEGPVASVCPASVLQHHRSVTVMVDEDAAAELRLADYYRWTYAHKPTWQQF